MTIPASAPYVYQPLENPRQQIRLLTVLPNRDPNSVIETKLTIHNLPVSNAPSRRARIGPVFQLPTYYAISYVWEKGTALQNTQSIRIDGGWFPVVSNVYAGLQEARSQNSYANRLWLDAICIDQSNDVEKDGQIPLMREIYHYSASTFIYIPGSVEDAKVMRFINNLNNHPLWNKSIDWWTTSYNKRSSENPESLSGKLQGILAQKSMKMFTKATFAIAKPVLAIAEIFFNHCADDGVQIFPRFQIDRDAVEKLKKWEPSEDSLRATEMDDLSDMAQRLQNTFSSRTEYFLRMWTFQEVIASTYHSIHCANIENSLESLLRTVHYLHRIEGLDQSFVDKMTTLWTVHENWIYRSRLSLRELLFHCRDRDCLDPKDKIYALLGLINNRTDSRLLPNQNYSVAEVYANATKYIASSEGCLDVICVCGKKERPKGLPSWAPNFQQFGLSDERVLIVDPSGRKQVFQASSTEPYEDFGPSDQRVEELRTKGLCLGMIRGIFPLTLPDTGLEPIEEIWNWIFTIDKDQEPAAQELLSDLSRLTCRLFEIHRLSDPSKRSEFWAGMETEIEQLSRTPYQNQQIKYLLTLMCGQAEHGTSCSATEAVTILRRACIRDPDGEIALSLLCNAIHTGVRGRRLVVLDGGHIGAVPEEAMLGDTVCVLLGCSVPVCLREASSSDEWTLVGECYVDGYMHGDAIVERDSGKAMEKTYLLV